jgi:hypothetical protein
MLIVLEQILCQNLLIFIAVMIELRFEFLH